MKASWVNPAIEAIELSATAYKAWTGTRVDGQYQDEDENGCWWEDAYWS